MSTPADNYRKGYEGGKNQSLGSAAAEILFAEMLRDDPGGLFKRGYQDAINNRPFNPPSIPIPSRATERFIPKFSENPFGWFFGVIIVVELWVLWQLIKSPFQLIGALSRSERPTLPVILKNVITAGLVITGVWLAHSAKDPQRSPSYTQSASVSPAAARLVGTWKFVQNGVPNGTITFGPNGRYQMPHDGGPIGGPYSVSAGVLVIEFPEIQFTAEILSEDQKKIRLRETMRVDHAQGNAVSHPNDSWDLIRD